MKWIWDKKYFAISVYVILTFTICLILFKIMVSWSETKEFLSSIISVISPFLTGLLIAYFMNPLIVAFEKNIFPKIKFGKFRMQSKKLKRILSILFSYLISIVFIIILLAIIIPQVTSSIFDFSNSFDNYLLNLTNKLNKFSFSFGDSSYFFDVNVLTKYITDNIPNSIEQVTSMIPNFFNIVKGFASGLINILIAIIVSVYFIYSKEGSLDRARQIVIAIFSEVRAQTFFDTLSYAHKVFSNFFIGKLIDSLIIGILCFIILLITKTPFALLISVFVGLTNVIPYFGPFVGGAIGFILLLLINPIKALWFLVIILGIQQFDGNILGPWILGDSIGLSPFWVIFAVIVFGSLFGPIGMFLGAPLFGVIKNLVDKRINYLYAKRIKSFIPKQNNKTP